MAVILSFWVALRAEKVYREIAAPGPHRGNRHIQVEPKGLGAREEGYFQSNSPASLESEGRAIQAVKSFLHQAVTSAGGIDAKRSFAAVK